MDVRKTILNLSLTAASLSAAYNAVNMIKNIKKMKTVINGVDYVELRRDSRHVAEMIDNLKCGI